MSELWVRRIGNTLVPSGTESCVALAKMPFGKDIHCTAKQPRNLQHHKLFWSIVHRVAEGIGSEPQNVTDVLKIATGHCTVVKTKTHGTLSLPKSISFAKMDQSEFSVFFEKCLITIFEEWGIDRSAFQDLIADKREAA